ncbi:MAG TPA: glucosaminidase domain-containing protein [Flavitalea sp.]|nr:glucosaminidase domain-containing protein [Flavitalea sp.]
MRLLFALLFMLGGLMAGAQPSADIIDYINNYKKLAMDEMQRTGIPASITLAQGIHETYAGQSELVLKSNNHFGIKCKDYWTGKKVYHDDDARGECFRKYDDPSMSYRDHSDFLRSGDRYEFLFKLDPEDYKSWALGLKKAGYATNPKYGPIIIKLIEDYNLQQYTLIAMGKMAPEEEVLAVNPKPATNIPSDISAFVKQQDPLQEIAPPPAVYYPSGEFMINNTKVIYAKQGTPLLSIAQEYDIPLSRLLEYNDMGNEEVLVKDQLVYLQRKRRTGSSGIHIVANGETLHDISQIEAIRMENLLEYNKLNKSVQPTVGEKLYLQAMSREKL